MTTEQKIIKTKVGVLELGRQLGNVSQACKRCGTAAMRKRLNALEAKIAQEGGVLTEAALERVQQEKAAHGEFESECSPYCGARHVLRGDLQLRGRIYQQTFIDTYSEIGFAKHAVQVDLNACVDSYNTERPRCEPSSTASRLRATNQCLTLTINGVLASTLRVVGGLTPSAWSVWSVAIAICVVRGRWPLNRSCSPCGRCRRHLRSPCRRAVAICVVRVISGCRHLRSPCGRWPSPSV
jgi:hypothetical protein